MKKWLLTAMCVLLLSGCNRYSPVSESTEGGTVTETAVEETPAIAIEEESKISISNEPQIPERERVKVKGIYVSAYMAGSKEMMNNILDQIDKTEINAVVIDVKDDSGRLTFATDVSPIATEIGACKSYIGNIDELIAELKQREIYVIARVVAFKDPYLAEQKPEWSLKNADGSIYRDNKKLAWVNPYKTEVWDYLVEVGKAAAEAGFDEIQFDYIRFAVDKTMKNVVYDEADTKGRSKTDIITEFVDYAYEKLAMEGIFVSADVFGAIIGSAQDSASVGQIYPDMSDHLDYICPMIYPSHYGDGNFGIEHPDMQPYETIFAALQGSKLDLALNRTEGKTQAVVRPWLQDFTASYLKNYINYGSKELRAQIQAVYDAGYDEWILWNASNKYSWGGLLTPKEAAMEDKKIEESRAALPPETLPQPTTAAPTQAETATPESSAAAVSQPATQAEKPKETAAKPKKTTKPTVAPANTEPAATAPATTPPPVTAAETVQATPAATEAPQPSHQETQKEIGPGVETSPVETVSPGM